MVIMEKLTSEDRELILECLTEVYKNPPDYPTRHHAKRVIDKLFSG